MVRFRNMVMAAMMVALVARTTAAQPVDQQPKRDSLWNGALIGLGAGVGSTAVLDAVFCENGFGDCDVPWKAYLTLGGIGAAAGAGIDLLIGRKAGGRSTALRLSPIIGPSRTGVRASLVLPERDSLPRLKPRSRAAPLTR